MISDEEIERCLDWKENNADSLGDAESNRENLRDFKKIKHAMLCLEAPQHMKMGEKEWWASAHSEYQEVVEGYKVAVKEHTALAKRFENARLKIEVWRTQCSNHKSGVF
jgi:hypothetical protein